MAIQITENERKFASRIARKFASRYRDGRIVAEDIESHLVLWMCEHQSVLERYRTEGSAGEGKLNVALIREANRLCATEVSHNLRGASAYDLQYTNGQVERVLPYIWDYAISGLQTVVPEHPTLGAPIGLGTVDVSRYDEALAIIADVSSAFYGLPNTDKDILAMRFRDDLTFVAIAKALGVKEDAARKRVNRAIQRIANKLTGGSNLNQKPNGKKSENYDE